MRARRLIGFGLLISSALTLDRCLVGFPDYPVGDLDASATGGLGGGGGAASGTGGTGGVVGSAGSAGSGALGGRGDAGAGGVAGSTGTAGTGTGGTGGGSGGTGGTAGSGGTGGVGGVGGAVAGRGRLVLNELDYDQINTDTSEFVEIYNASTSDARLDGIDVVFVNGEAVPPRDYARFSLSGTLGPNGFAVVASPNVVVIAGARVFRFAVQQDNIQNGPPDAIGLLDTETHQLLDALSYEGSVSSAVLTNETGTFNFVEGTATSAADDSSAAKSLVRLPDGQDTNDAMNDWSVTLTLTPGGPNL